MSYFPITAGVFCALVSHPADTIVSKLNQEPGGNFIEAGKKLGLLGKSDFVREQFERP